MSGDEWVDSIHTGDAFDILPTLDAESVHAVVTDPPYGLAFMGRDWDDFEPREYQEWCEEWGREVKRVLRPGGHLLAFSGNRTHHRLFAGIEDAGFEIRDTLTWHYGSGFPKALDVSKAIDKAEGAEREVVDTKEYESAMSGGTYDAGTRSGEMTGTHEITAPATDAAERWGGWKTALKPATEFVVLARKPLAEGTVAENVREWGTAALNINGCRVEYDSGDDLKDTRSKNPGRDESVTSDVYGKDRPQQAVNTEGRYPANVVFDETAATALDRAVGECYSASGEYGTEGGDEALWGSGDENEYTGHDAHGGPSRYFYTSKATRAERTLDGKIDNAHPTVKPADLMEWLVTLATREGQTVLDPFTGTGTTCRAAKDLGRRFVGIEQSPEWADVARVRCGLTPEDPARVRGDDEQHGLETFTD